MCKDIHWFFFILSAAASLVLAPLSIGFINKTKAFFAGRKGVSVLQLYFDIFKLVRKERVHSCTSNWILQIAPLASLGLIFMAFLFMPLGSFSSPLSFTGDVIFFFYLLGTSRFLTVLAALETGSSFEGMGASREVQFSALAEGTLFAILGCLALRSGEAGLTAILCKNSLQFHFLPVLAPLLLVAGAFYLLLLCENCRVPFDDPETHLELTMIHEAMILDYSGTDLAAILYASSLKLWIFAAFITSMLIPPGVFALWQETALFFGGVILIAVLTGIVESSMARFRFLKVPPLLIAAAIMPVLAILICLFFLNGGVR